MVPRLTLLSRLTLLRLTAGLLLVLIVVIVSRFTPTVSSRTAILEQDLKRTFVAHQTLQMDARTVSQQVRETGRMSVATSDLSFDLELVPNDIRASGYRAEEFGADGVGRAIDIGPVNTFKGRARGRQGGAPLPQLGEARFTIDEKGIEGLIITPTEHYFVESARKYSKAAYASDYIVYRESDVVTNTTGECGVTLSEQVNQRVAAIRQENASTINQIVKPSSQLTNPQYSVNPEQSKHSKAPVDLQSTLTKLGIVNNDFSWEEIIGVQKNSSQAITSGISEAITRVPGTVTPSAAGCVAEPVSSGQMLTRTLGPGCAFQGGQLTDVFMFSGFAGHQLTITMSSTAFAPQLYLWYGPVDALIFATQSNDGSAVNSTKIPGSGTYTLPATSTYYIYASSVLSNRTGDYKITLSSTPPNDGFGNARTITGSSGNASVNSLGATKEIGEPNHGGNIGGASVWYRWQAPTSDTATFATTGSNFDTLLGVYTGESVSSLTTIASNDNVNGQLQSRVSFATTAGTVYLIAVDGLNAATGDSKLNWNPPSNDSFANAQLISGAFGNAIGRNTGATKDPGEANHANNEGGASVWYKWVAPSNGSVTFKTKGSNFDTLLGVYAGSSITSLTTIASNDDDDIGQTSKVTFAASAGVTYYIAVDGFKQLILRTGNIMLSWRIETIIQSPPPPINDNFSNAQLLSTSAGTAIGTNVSATVENGEPSHAGEASIWYKWQSPGVGTVTFTTFGSDFDTLLGVYTGATVNALTTIANNDDDPSSGIQSKVTFFTLTGITYHIAIDGFRSETGNTKLNWTFPPAPANDGFDNAEVISGSSGSASGTNIGASKEIGEPNHAGFLGAASVWYKWQAPGGGVATFTTAGSNFDTLLGVYNGPAVSSLTTIAGNDDAAGSSQSSVTFVVSPGTTYYVAVDGYKAAIGNLTLNWTLNTSTSTPTPTPTPTPIAIPDPTPFPFVNLRVATEADHEFVLSKGGTAAAAQEILGIMNQVDGIYEAELGITFRVAYQSAWNSPNQPYSSTNATALLGELTNYWNANRGSVGRDVVHMWTGKQLDSATIGTAYLEALCRYTGNGRAAYGLSMSIPGKQQVAIAAHEIGHNLGATHPNQQVPAPTDCNNTIMSSSVTATQQMDFCEYSKNEIANYLNTSTSCLTGDTTHFSFASPKAFPGNPSLVGDFNLDGKDDVITQSNGILVLLGSDNGDFSPVFNYPNASAAAVGDFNNDGKPDIVTASGSTVSVLVGSGTGSFQRSGDNTAGKSLGSFVVGDFNVDGNQDIAALDVGGINVLFGTGSGGFQPPVSFDAGENPLNLRVGDFNGDRAPDLVVANGRASETGGVSFLLNTGNGAFQPPFRIPLSTSIPRISVGDFNGDQISDVAVALPEIPFGFSVNVMILLGNENGVFRFGLKQFISAFENPTSTALGDFNGDGKFDLAVAGGGTSGRGIEVWQGTEAGFSSHIIYNLPGSGFLTVGDFNGDGNHDLISAGLVILGSSTGLQAPHKLSLHYPTSLAAADFNRDGKQDLVVTNTYDPILTEASLAANVFFGTGTGEFEASPMRAITFQRIIPYLLDVTTGDFNNDGIADLAVTEPPFNGTKGLSVVLGTSSGFDAPISYDAGPRPTAVAANDFNGDGKLDLVVANNNNGSGEIGLMLGTGSGAFQTYVTATTVAAVPSDLTTGDFNRDGRPDVALTYDVLNITSVLFGMSGGGFTSPVNFNAVGGTVTVGDFNLDGNLDLAVGGFNVLLGNGAGGFREPIKIGDGGGSGLVAADFNNDGKTDIAAASGFIHPFDTINMEASVYS